MSTIKPANNANTPIGAYSIIISTIFIIISFKPSKAFYGTGFSGDDKTKAIPKRTKNII